jgi:hypothetical protein
MDDITATTIRSLTASVVITDMVPGEDGQPRITVVATVEVEVTRQDDGSFTGEFTYEGKTHKNVPVDLGVGVYSVGNALRQAIVVHDDIDVGIGQLN